MHSTYQGILPPEQIGRKPRTAKFSALINTGVKFYEFGSRLPRARRGRGRGGQVSTTRLHVNDFPRNSCKDQGRPYQLFAVSEFNPVNIRQTMLCSLLCSRRLLRTCLYTNKPRSTHSLIMSMTLEKTRMSALCTWNTIAGRFVTGCVPDATKNDENVLSPFRC